MNELIYYDEITRSLSQAVYHAYANVKNVNGLLKMTIQSGMWRKRMETVTGAIVEFSSFEDYVVGEPPQGLGTDIPTLKLLSFGDEELLSLIENASTVKPIPPQQRSEKIRKPKRLSREWTVDKLIEAQRLDLLKELTAGKISCNAIHIMMGWRKKSAKVPIQQSA